MSYRVHNLFVLSPNGEESENPFLAALTLTYNSLGFERLSRYMFPQNFVKISSS